MTIALIVVICIFVVFAIVAGCAFSDANWVIQKYLCGDDADKDCPSDRERIYRAKLGTDLMLILCVIFGVASGFGLLFVLLANF